MCTPPRPALPGPTGTGWRCSTTPSSSRRALRDATGLDDVEARLEALVSDGPTYAARDAGLALADLAHQTGHREEAAARYRDLVEVVPEGPLREFCRRRSV